MSIETQTTRGARYVLDMLVLFGFIDIFVIWSFQMPQKCAFEAVNPAQFLSSHPTLITPLGNKGFSN